MKTFDQLYQAALDEKYPSFEISQSLRNNMIDALHFASPLTMGLSGTKMKSLYDKLREGEKLTYYEFACASNNLEARTPNELTVTPVLYFNLMIEIEELGAKFNAETADIRQSVIQELAKQKIPAPPGSLSGNSSLKVVN